MIKITWDYIHVRTELFSDLDKLNLVLGWSQILILTQLPQKIFDSKVVKIDPKIIKSQRQPKSVTHIVQKALFKAPKTTLIIKIIFSAFQL